MKLVTIQAAAFKSTFEVLKDILNDVNVYFRRDGMYIVTLDTARTSLVDIFLSADNFEEYKCEQEEVIAGINISNTFKLLKTITNNDVLQIDINCKEYMNISISSDTKKTNTKFQLKLLDINESRIEVPEVEMTTSDHPPVDRFPAPVSGHVQHRQLHRDRPDGKGDQVQL
jgi:proliferating cell nuclear antigen